MKTQVSKFASTILVLIYCSLQCNFIQIDSTQALKALDKGIIFLKEDRIIKNIRLMQINELYIVYEKNGNLHDLMKDEIKSMEFINAHPKPMVVVFENNIAVFSELQYKTHLKN